MGKKCDLPYVRPNRLADVMALIQVLALHRAGDRSSEGLQGEMQGIPRSADAWEDIARQHPEFFRVNPDARFGVSLVSRHALPIDEERKRPRLSPSFTAMLLRTAIELHDRQVRRNEEWKTWIPIGEAIATGAMGILGVLVGVWVS